METTEALLQHISRGLQEPTKFWLLGDAPTNIPSDRDHKALKRGTSGGAGSLPTAFVRSPCGPGFCRKSSRIRGPHIDPKHKANYDNSKS